MLLLTAVMLTLGAPGDCAKVPTQSQVLSALANVNVQNLRTLTISESQGILHIEAKLRFRSLPVWTRIPKEVPCAQRPKEIARFIAELATPGALPRPAGGASPRGPNLHEGYLPSDEMPFYSVGAKRLVMLERWIRARSE